MDLAFFCRAKQHPSSIQTFQAAVVQQVFHLFPFFFA
jgi:hypothetical protein